MEILSNSALIKELINKDTAIRNLLSKYAIAEGEDWGPDTFAAHKEIEKEKLLGLTFTFVFNQMRAPEIKDTFDESGIVETYRESYAAYLQRIHYNTIKPIGPYYQAENLEIPSQFDKRLASTTERFLGRNMDYQNLISQLDDYTVQQIFANEYGLANYLAGPAMVLDASYKQYKTMTVYEVLDSILRNTRYPLKDTQKIFFPLTDHPTKEDLRAFILFIKNKITEMDMYPTTNKYNAGGYEHYFEKSKYVLLLRPGIMNMIQTNLLENSYHMDMLNLPIEVREVMHFGGLKPTVDGTTPLFPVYDKWASLIGFNTHEGQSEVEYTEEQVKWIDPNEDVIGLIVEKGIIVYNDANPMMMPVVRNELGGFSNLIANKPKCSMNYDPDYNAIAIYKSKEVDKLTIQSFNAGSTTGTTIATIDGELLEDESYIYNVTNEPVLQVLEYQTPEGETFESGVTEVNISANQYLNIFKIDGDKFATGWISTNVPSGSIAE